MLKRPKIWIATVTYTSELGDLEVDFGVDDLVHLHAIVRTGLGYGAIAHMAVERNPYYSKNHPSIENLIGVKHDLRDAEPAYARDSGATAETKSRGSDLLGEGLPADPRRGS